VSCAYIAKLNREMEAEREQAEPDKLDLRQRFINWYDSLPEVARDRPFSMAEVEAELGTQGKYLSPILLRLGWQRKRRWSSSGQSNRYWVPPSI